MAMVSDSAEVAAASTRAITSLCVSTCGVVGGVAGGGSRRGGHRLITSAASGDGGAKAQPRIQDTTDESLLNCDG